jgi:hypothetical protein
MRERLAKDKHSSLLWKFVINGQKSFIKLAFVVENVASI